MPARRVKAGPRPQIRRVGSATAEFQLALSLRSNRRQRKRQKRFLVEGVRPIEKAIEHGWTVDSLWYRAGQPLSRWAQSLLERPQPGTRFELTPALMDRLSQKDEASELAAVFEMPPDDLARITPGHNPLLVIFDRPVSPGNLGSVIRSADALGSQGLVVTGHGADIYDPQTIRATTGSLFSLPVVHGGSMSDLERWIEGLRGDLPALQLVGSSARGDTLVSRIDFTRPTVLVIGNETKGLSWAWKELCDEVAMIPIGGSASSLNAAAAAAVLLYEVDRQRRAR
jgi:tRNA G18 (ribose-2'-O)-methylase SpoU